MKEIRREELNEELSRHLLEVESTLERSYCPHSGLCVAAGLVLGSGQLVTGINYESASYGLTQCAERNAIGRAQAEDKIYDVRSLLLSARNRDNKSEAAPLTPCGACRQWLTELSDRLGRDIVIYSFWNGARAGIKSTAQELLPKAFL